MRARAADGRYDGFPQATALRLLDAIEALTAENARLTSALRKAKADRLEAYRALRAVSAEAQRIKAECGGQRNEVKDPDAR